MKIDEFTSAEVRILLHALCCIDSVLQEYDSAKEKLLRSQQTYLHSLRNEWTCWCSLQGIDDIDAREYLEASKRKSLSQYQRDYIESFVARWDAAL